MKTIILHILCEGQTEELFVKNVLKDYLSAFGIICKPQLLLTNKQKNCRGGLLSYTQVTKDLQLMFKQFVDNKKEVHWFTTMFDLYKLPHDFPGYGDTFGNIYDKINHIEIQFAQNINHSNFIPYIQLHEYEALVFANLDSLEAEYPASNALHKKIDELRAILRTKNNNPELVNTLHAPSKYIISALEGIHHYNKPKIGASVAQKTNIQNLKEICEHFAQWVDKLEAIQVAPTQPIL